MNPFSLVSWAPWIVAAGSIAIAGVMYVGKSTAERNAADERAQWAEEKAQIERKSAEDMRQAIEAHNATAKQLELAHAEALAYRATIDAHAASAATAGAAAARAERRLHDAAATTALAARAQAEAAGTAGQCKSQLATIDLYSKLLQRLNAEAGSLGTDALAISRHADEAYAAATECSKWATEVSR